MEQVKILADALINFPNIKQSVYIAIIVICVNALTYFTKEFLDKKKKKGLNTASFMLEKRLSILEEKFSLIQRLNSKIMQSYNPTEVRESISRLRVRGGKERLYLERFEIKRIHKICDIIERIIVDGLHGSEEIDKVLTEIKDNLYT